MPSMGLSISECLALVYLAPKTGLSSSEYRALVYRIKPGSCRTLEGFREAGGEESQVINSRRRRIIEIWAWDH